MSWIIPDVFLDLVEARKYTEDLVIISSDDYYKLVTCYSKSLSNKVDVKKDVGLLKLKIITDIEKECFTWKSHCDVKPDDLALISTFERSIYEIFDSNIEKDKISECVSEIIDKICVPASELETGMRSDRLCLNSLDLTIMSNKIKEFLKEKEKIQRI